MLPGAATAAAATAGSSASTPSAVHAALATSPCPNGLSASRRQRDRMVGSNRPGAWLTSRNKDLGGGSSSIFKSALEPSGYLSSSALATMQTRHPPSPAVEPKEGARRPP